MTMRKTRPAPSSGPEQAIEPQNNLPGQLTPLLGRQQEVLAACTLLQRPDLRLLTLTGPGGVGKTHLALQIARDLLLEFADGVYFISLAPVSDSALVFSRIAGALSLAESADLPLFDQLKEFLHNQHILLLLDNFEQVLVAAPLLIHLLVACPDLKMLVTSRAPLHVRGEQEYQVPPLALPNLKQLPASELLTSYASIALFMQRAQAVKPTFVLTKANARAIAEICSRLDGLPLAIELAAVRIKLLTPQAVLALLGQHPLELLTGGAHDLPIRQQTLRNTIAWSYHLLNAHEQRLFRRFAVFVGSSTLEAVKIVCGTGTQKNEQVWDGYSPMEVLEGVTALLDNSLLYRVEQENGESRLAMLQTIREFALECLTNSGEAEAICYIHAKYYLALAETAESGIGGVQQPMWLKQLEQEHDNLRAALRWLLENARDSEAQRKAAVEMALRLAGALWWFWQVHGYRSEGRQWLGQALLGSKGTDSRIRAKALNSAGMLAYSQDDHAAAELLCGQSLALFRELGDLQGIGNCLYRLGLVARVRHNYAQAYSLAQESLSLFKSLNNDAGVADALLLLGYIALDQHEYAQARACIEEGVALFRALDDTWGVAYALPYLARAIFLQGDAARAIALIEECLARSHALHYKGGLAYGLTILGQIVLQQGDAARAYALLEESLALHRELGDRWGIAESLFLLAEATAAQENYGAAYTFYEQSLPIFREMEEPEFIAACLQGLEEVTVAFQRVRAQPTSVPPSAIRPTPPVSLTAREIEVLRLVALGLTDAQVAEKLIISTRTVNAHLSSIYSKIQVSTRSAATRYALDHKLV